MKIELEIKEMALVLELLEDKQVSLLMKQTRNSLSKEEEEQFNQIVSTMEKINIQLKG